MSKGEFLESLSPESGNNRDVKLHIAYNMREWLVNRHLTLTWEALSSLACSNACVKVDVVVNENMGGSDS